MSKYDTNVAPYLAYITSLAREGKTEKEIAKRLKVSYSTLRKYIEKYEVLKEALKEGKNEADAKVEAGLYFSAMGGTKILKKPMKVRNTIIDKFGKKIGEKEEIVYADEEVYYPPNITSIIFWLCNRKKEVWKHQRNIEFTADNGKKIEITFGDAKEYSK